jgi:hypothetical protein
MNSLHKSIEFDLIEIGNEGICIRYSPLEHANIHGTNESDIDNFKKSLEDIIDIMDASIKCKTSFDKDIKNFKNLMSVNVPKWAGVGAVRYIPDYLLTKLDAINSYLIEKKNKNLNLDTKSIDKQSLIIDPLNESHKSKDLIDLDSNLESNNQSVAPSDNESSNDSVKTVKIHSNKTDLEKEIEEIVKLNEQVLKELQSQDGAYSLGEGSDGLIAIKFGMVDEVEAIAKLAEQVQTVGKQVEESTRVFIYFLQLTNRFLN